MPRLMTVCQCLALLDSLFSFLSFKAFCSHLLWLRLTIFLGLPEKGLFPLILVYIPIYQPMNMMSKEDYALQFDFL